MKENSIEKDEEILNNIKAYMQENIDKGFHKFVYNDLGYDEKCVDVINAIEHLLSDYKRVLKENEELLEVKVSASAHNRILELEKENEELKADNYELNNRITDLLENIPVQKIKDKIEEYKNMLKTCNKAKDIDRIKAINERILELQELIEKER